MKSLQPAIGEMVDEAPAELAMCRRTAWRIMPLIVVVGRWSDASGERPKFVAALWLMGALGFFTAGIFVKQTVFLVAALGVMGAGVIASIPAFWALPPKLVSGAGAAGGIALINTLGQLGGIVSPVMVGRIKDLTGSTTPALYVIGTLGVVCAGLLVFALPEKLRTRDKV